MIPHITVPFDYQSMIYKQIKMEGFMVNRWFSEFPEGVGQLAEWIHQVRLLPKHNIFLTIRHPSQNSMLCFLRHEFPFKKCYV